MRTVDFSEIKPVAEYERIRDGWRPSIMSLKDRRRVRVGDHLTFLFENRETVLYQIQEMMRVERITGETEIRHELKTYNELIPAQGELSACLLIEYETPEERAVKLRELMGLDKHIWFEVAGARALARFDDRQIGDTRISSVQYLKWTLTPEMQSGWSAGARIAVDHPYYHVTRELSAAELEELSRDFA